MVSRLMSSVVRMCGLSNTGLVRQNNEDYWAKVEDELFFVLADGMGGHQAGEVASQEAVKGICELYVQAIEAHGYDRENEISLIESLRFAIEQANARVYELGQACDAYRGMGTTLCCLHILGDRVIFGHVGDSRIYRYRNKILERLTRDHSLLVEMVESGHLDDLEEETFLYKNILTRALGTGSNVEPTVDIDEVQPGDLFLMATDGLTDMLADEEIEAIIRRMKVRGTEELATALVNAANGQGGHDNITVIVVEVVDEGSDLPG